MIQIREGVQLMSLAQAIADNDIDTSSVYQKRGRYNQNGKMGAGEKSFAGNVKAIAENGMEWYRKRFKRNECCGTAEKVTEKGLTFCEKCGFLCA